MSSPKDNRPISNNYRKPPVEHQFKKGVSGNPGGRPKKKQALSSALGGGIADRLSAMVLEEATRTVTVREGDTVSELPAVQALLRAMFRVAAKGDVKVGRPLLELITRSETSRANAALENLKDAAAYKERYRPFFEENERQGLEPPEIYPHPDDIIINEHTAEVEIDGPESKEQAGARKALREQALKSLGRYFELESALKQDPSNRKLKREFKGLQKYLDFIRAESERNSRHEALRIARRTLEPKAPASKDDSSDEA